MRTFYFNSFLFKAISCLMFLQLSITLPSHAQNGVQIRVEDLTDLKISTTGPELRKMQNLSVKIMKHTPLYNLINNEFGPIIQGSPNSKQRLTETKILYLLSHTQEYWDDLEDYLKKFPKEKVNDPELAAAREKFHNLFDKVVQDLKLKSVLSSKDDLMKPLHIVDRNTGLSFSRIEGYFNHPGQTLDKNNKKIDFQPTDFVEVLLKVINSAEAGDELLFNVYDANITEIADALIEAHKRGVKITGGLDKKVVESAPATKSFYKKLLDAGIFIKLVDSVGLNHQKLVALIKANGTSVAIEISGNLTYSCISRKGDLPQIPDKDLPKTAIPNPNNMIYMEGDIPAAVVASEIEKSVVHGVRGLNQFPLGGLYLFDGPPREGYPFNEWQALTFSPNGGLGDVMEMVAEIIRRTAPSRQKVSVFSLSSEAVGGAVVDKLVETIKAYKKANRPLDDVFQAIIDGRFAIRDFSILMKMVGIVRVEYDPSNPNQDITDIDTLAKDPDGRQTTSKKDTVVAYIEDVDNEYASKIRAAFNNQNEWEKFRHSIRLTPPSFNTTTFNYKGEEFTYEVKNHHKLEILSDAFITSMGTSGNYSAAVKANQEQISFVYSERLTQKANYHFDYLFNGLSNESYSIPNIAKLRNSFLPKEQYQTAIGIHQKRKQKAKKDKILGLKSSKDLSCPAVFK